MGLKLSVFKNHKTSADRSATDRSRHKDKIKKAIKEGVYNIVSEESIIGKDGKKKIRIPVRGIKEYRFVYGSNKSNKKVGSAHNKDVKRGQKIADKSKKKQKGDGQKPGNKPGEDFYDVEITLEEMSKYLFDDLNLPDLDKKKMSKLISEKFKRSGYTSTGITPRLSKKESLKNKIKRKKAAERALEEGEDLENFSFHESDLRYKRIKKKNIKNSNAVIFFMMDTSGSMTPDKKFLARSFFFLLYHFIRSKYDETEIVFISHTSSAKEVSEDDFFRKGSSGGTMISSALEKCKEIISSRYHPDIWNIYTFHCSDGDNFPSDNEKAVRLSAELKKICQLYGFIQTQPTGQQFWSDGGIVNHYTKISDSKFRIAHVDKKEDVWSEFKRILGGAYELDT